MNDYLQEIYDWAYFNMEGCDEPEFSLYDGLCNTIMNYWRWKESAEEKTVKKKHIEPCIICDSNIMYHTPQYHEDVFGNGYSTHAIFCNSCKTTFSNEHYEESEEETIEWFNNLPRKEQ